MKNMEHRTHVHGHPTPLLPIQTGCEAVGRVQRDAWRPQKGDTRLVSIQQPLYASHVTLTEHQGSTAMRTAPRPHPQTTTTNDTPPTSSPMSNCLWDGSRVERRWGRQQWVENGGQRRRPAKDDDDDDLVSTHHGHSSTPNPAVSDCLRGGSGEQRQGEQGGARRR
jgi:hypothetical protein